MVEPRNGLFFLTIDFVKSQVNRAGYKTGLGSTPVVFDCKHMSGIDYSGSKVVVVFVYELNCFIPKT